MQDDQNIYQQAVAAEVRALMGRRQTRQPEIMKALGLSQPAVSDRLRGKVPFSLNDIFALARYFDVKLSALLPEPADVANVDGGDMRVSRNAARRGLRLVQGESNRSEPAQLEPVATYLPLAVGL